MELVYLWVEEYKNIKRQGFNFSPRFRCEFKDEYRIKKYSSGLEREELEVNCKFIVEKRESIRDLYGDRIRVSAIVGENGVGKSNVLEILSDKYIGYENLKVFYVFYDSTMKRFSLHGARINTKTIYFSNILNKNDLFAPIHFEDKCYSEFINISTSQLLNQRKLIETSLQGNIGAESKTGFDKIYRSYQIQQIQSSILAIQNGMKVPFSLPKKLVIKNIDFQSLIENSISKFSDNRYRKILDVIRRNNDEQTIFRNYLSTNLIISLLLENINSNNPILNELLDVVLDQKMISSLDDFYKNARDKLYHRDFSIDSRNFPAGYINEFFDLSEIILDAAEKFEYIDEQRYIVELEISEHDFAFLEAYEKLIQNSEYFWDISWRGISSGEETFLYQFSRLHFLKEGYKKDYSMNLKMSNSKEIAKNLIILIDEGEINLHPQWQRDYISYLIDFLKNNFEQNIHIILTTHSPFILSDILNENIIFLNKYKSDDDEVIKGLKEEGQCQVLKDGIDERTFGANIHTLLSNGFFMKEGLIGKFAKTKIKDVFDYLEKRVDKTSMTKEEIKLLIDSLGEVVLRNKLTELYNSFFSIKTKEEEYLEEIKKLKEENKRLKNVSN